jgi:hypothetical protein
MSEHTDLFPQLVAISQQAFTGVHYEAAYHALAAALHYAQDTGSAEQLEEVSRMAGAQLAYIDANAPDSVMSSQAATDRHGVDLLATLKNIASARARMIRDSEHLSGQPSSPTA